MVFFVKLYTWSYSYLLRYSFFANWVGDLIRMNEYLSEEDIGLHNEDRNDGNAMQGQCQNGKCVPKAREISANKGMLTNLGALKRGIHTVFTHTSSDRGHWGAPLQ